MNLFLPEAVLCMTNQYILSFHRGSLYTRDAVTKQLIHRRRLFQGIKTLRPAERMFRMEPRAATAIREDCFLFSCKGAIYRYEADSDTLVKEHTLTAGMSSPLSFCAGTSANGRDPVLLYGEYFLNRKRRPVAIYRRTEAGWEKVFVFRAGEVCHIHGIVPDPRKNRYLILTGDSDQESGLWSADLEFHRVVPVAKGSQQYRACVAFPAENGIYYATDTPAEQNHIYRLQEQADGSARAERLFDLPGSCIYGGVNGEKYYFITCVECAPHKNFLRFLLTYKRGAGIQDGYVHIFEMDAAEEIHEIGRFPKDIFPMGLMQFGNARMPEGPQALFTLTATRGSDGTTVTQ